MRPGISFARKLTARPAGHQSVLNLALINNAPRLSERSIEDSVFRLAPAPNGMIGPGKHDDNQRRSCRFCDLIIVHQAE
jgi:hypothetical protein